MEIRLGNLAHPTYGLSKGMIKKVYDEKTIAGKKWFKVFSVEKERLIEVWVAENEVQK